jgi:hypothetical protein
VQFELLTKCGNPPCDQARLGVRSTIFRGCSLSKKLCTNSRNPSSFGFSAYRIAPAGREAGYCSDNKLFYHQCNPMAAEMGLSRGLQQHWHQRHSRLLAPPHTSQYAASPACRVVRLYCQAVGQQLGVAERQQQRAAAETACVAGKADGVTCCAAG